MYCHIISDYIIGLSSLHNFKGFTKKNIKSHYFLIDTCSSNPGIRQHFSLFFGSMRRVSIWKVDWKSFLAFLSSHFFSFLTMDIFSLLVLKTGFDIFKICFTGFRSFGSTDAASFLVRFECLFMASSSKDDRKRNLPSFWFSNLGIFPSMTTCLVLYTGLDIFKVFLDDVLLLSTTQKRSKKSWILDMLTRG